MIKIIRSCFSQHILFVFVLLILFHVIVIGAPLPPGYLNQASQAYLESHPGYVDIMSGEITAADLTDNVDVYNSYLRTVIVILSLNIILPFFLFVLLLTLIWNYILHKKISVRFYWKSFLVNLISIIILTICGYFGYVFVLLLRNISSTGAWTILMNFLLIVMFTKLAVLLMCINQILMRAGAISDIFGGLLRIYRAGPWRLLVGAFGCLAFISLISLLYYIPGMTFALLSVFVVIAWHLSLAWLHMYIAHVAR